MSLTNLRYSIGSGEDYTGVTADFLRNEFTLSRGLKTITIPLSNVNELIRVLESLQITEVLGEVS